MLSEKKNPSTNVHKIIVTIFFAAYYPVKPKKKVSTCISYYFVDFNFTDFLLTRGLPSSTTDLSSKLSLQLLEHLEVEPFFNETACDRSSFTGALPSGFVKGWC